MSTNKNFLPFITEQSSPQSIYKAILQRTKGSPPTAVLALFMLIISRGIGEVRATIGMMPDELPTSEKVREAISGYAGVPTASEQMFFNWVWPLEEKTKNLTESMGVTSQETSTFLTALFLLTPKTLDTWGLLQGKLSVCTKFSKECYDIGLSALEERHGIVIAETGERLGFACWEAFKAFLALQVAGDDGEKPRAIMPVLVNADVINKSGFKDACKQHDCVSPKMFTNEN